MSENFSMTSTNHAKYLSFQIPQFSKSAEDNVELWLEKPESIVEIHGFSYGVMLSAAISKLTKTALV